MANAFRSRFVISNPSVIHWFPGHMAKGLQQIMSRGKRCDVVLEIHDARVPLSGRNPRLSQLLAGKPRILVLNKADLADENCTKWNLCIMDTMGSTQCPDYRGVLIFQEFVSALRSEGKHYVFAVNSKAHSDNCIKEILPCMVDLAGGKVPKTGIKIMILGTPNIGKSSFINAMRRCFLKKSKAAPVGALAGVTRSVQTKITVSDDPLVYLLDTPGILEPKIDNPEVGMKLAVTGMLRDYLVGLELIADYLLYSLNKHGKFDYVTHFNMDKPSDNIDTVLQLVAKRIGALMKGGRIDYLRAAEHFIVKYRAGKLGRMTLDIITDINHIT